MSDNGFLARELNKIATIIEAICYDEGTPLVVGDEDIAVLGDQCRFSAHPVRSQSELEQLQLRLLGRSDVPYRASGNPYSDLPKLRKVVSPIIKGELGLPTVSNFGINIGNRAVIFDFRLSDLLGREYFIPLVFADLQTAPRPNRIPIGRTLESETVIINNERGHHCHILIAGMTRSGKTVLANTYLYGLACAYRPTQLRLLMASGKPEDVQTWDGLPHLLAPPTSDPQTALAMLGWVEEEREKRARMEPEEKKFLPRLVIYMGEVSLLVDKSMSEFTNILENLVRLGGSEKIHLVVATQRPRGDRVGSVDVKGQFSLVICGRMANPQDAYIALGIGESDAQFLPGNGAFVTNNGKRFQAAFVADAENNKAILKLIEVLQANYGEPEYIVLPNSSYQGHIAEDGSVDAWQAMKALYEDSADSTSINRLMQLMRWGYPRAARAWNVLETRGIIGERGDSKRALIDIDALKGQLESGLAV